MSSLARRLAPHLTGVLTSPRTRSLRRWAAEGRRRLSRAPHRLLYFHQADDPYSHLAVQALQEVQARYAVELVPHLVGPPSDAAAPERARLEAFSRRDAADVATGYGLTFPPGAEAPRSDHVALAQGILAGALGGEAFAERAERVGAALWSGGDRAGAALEALANELGVADRERTGAAIKAGNTERARRGHYLGAMLHYGGEWYWGVDRLHHLERRLLALGVRRAGTGAELVAPRPQPDRIGRTPTSRSGLSLEFFLSLRSPYTYIAMERLFALADRLPVALVLRPVLPMVMRGLPVPREKQLYIVLDTKREAEHAGVAFGRVCDPVGRPVERAFSLYRWSREQGRAGEFLHAFARAAFAEGVDTGTQEGMRYVVERAGLSFPEAAARLDGDDGWREELEANREALFALGLWGVPSFCLRSRSGEALYATWGQDRLWRVEEEIRRRLAEPERREPRGSGAS